MSKVSIVIPCFNEESTITELLTAIYAQSYPRELLEVIIADGMSTDGTRQRIKKFSDENGDLNVRVVDNSTGTIPAALNIAIKDSLAGIIVRLDAHSAPYPDYVEKCVEDLQSGRGDNVGGVWEILPGDESWLAESIAVAAAHPLAVGDAKYRYTKSSGEVDTVPFGSFRKDLVEEIGYFDETLLANEDYEFNVRVKQQGKVVWLNPEIRSRYYARRDITELARQYWRYGRWKVEMLRRYPSTIRWRQALPPVFVLSFILLGIAAIWSDIAQMILGIEVVLYGLVLLVMGTLMATMKKKTSMILGFPLAVATMHIAWGSAFLWSLVGLKKPQPQDGR